MALRESAKTRYCFTFNCPADWGEAHATEQGPLLLAAAEASNNFLLMVFQLEKAPSTERLHYQGFAKLNTAVHKRGLRLQPAKGVFSMFPNCHLEPTRATTAKAIAYCQKEESWIAGPWSFGDLGTTQGRRSDLLDLKESVDQNIDAVTLWDEHFASMVRYHKSIEVYRNLRIESRSEQTELIIHVGGSGFGKTTYIMDENPGSYWVSAPTKGQSLWWDGYKQQEVVVMDEFRGWWFPFSVLLNLANKSPFKVQAKGQTSTEFTSKRILIATNNHPLTFYPNVGDLSAFERRITEIYIWTGYKEFTIFRSTDRSAWDNYQRSDLFGEYRFVTAMDHATN